ncbi:MAG TPA: sulfatase-like hydrolase/transferase [Bryobacteraceae bacterium]|nr:sulfatase-like hydrolase/transferase [Bryobacteraceae bacterium]
MGRVRPALSRFLVYALLICIPIVRVLLHEDYGFLHPEVFAILGLHLAAAGLLALVTWTAFLRGSVTIALLVLYGSFPLLMMMPSLRIRYTALLIVVIGTAGILLLRERFYSLLAVFLAATFGGDLVKAAWERTALPASLAASSQSRAPTHTLHVIFDEMQGLGSLPAFCESCKRARRTIEAALEQGNFHSFPNAYSNYRTTRDSVPSLLNDRLVTKAHEYIASELRPVLETNAYFDSYLAKGYDIHIYQSDHILYGSGKYASLPSVTYKANSLAGIHYLQLPWTARVGQVLSWYLLADWFWAQIWEKTAPAAWQPHVFSTFPVASRKIWPEQIVRDVKATKKDTLFFVHLLNTHRPHIIRPDGSIRPLAEWEPDGHVVYHEGEESRYRRSFEAYGEQLEFAAKQMTEVLQGLRDSELYDRMTIVFHGDHGSRIRLVPNRQMAGIRKLMPDGSDSDYYDYPEGVAPTAEDLSNRFATFLALKLPGSTSARLVEEPNSVLSFFRQYLSHSGTAESEGVRSVYLFSKEGQPREIPMLRFWPSTIQTSSLSTRNQPTFKER